MPDTDTTDYEELLALPHVTGVEYNEEDDVVIVFVDEKVPEDELPPNAIVSHAVEDEQESDVVETGVIRLQVHGRAASERDPSNEQNHRSRARPVRGGLSEGVSSRIMAGTCGPLARVRDPTGTNWSLDAEDGQLVRISNCHVYADARDRAGLFGDRICQPARLDGGLNRTEMIVGTLLGYVPLSSERAVGGALIADCAARTATDADAVGVYGLDESYPSGVRREYGDLRGGSVVKSGRTTGVTEGEVLATSATIRVEFDEMRIETFRDQLITTAMSEAGDSGSGVYDSDGELTGLLFAGSEEVTVLNKIANVEEALGVEMVTDADEPDEDDIADEPITDPDDPGEDTGTGDDGDRDPDRGFTIAVSSGMPAGTLEYSFAVSESSDVEFAGRSSTQIDNRVVGWVSRWTNHYTVTGEGVIEDVSFPPESIVTVEGVDSPVDPDELPELSLGLREDRGWSPSQSGESGSDE